MLRTSFTVRLQILYIPYLPTTILRHSSSALNVGVTFTKTFLSNITCWNTHKKNRYKCHTITKPLKPPLQILLYRFRRRTYCATNGIKNGD